MKPTLENFPGGSRSPDVLAAEPPRSARDPSRCASLGEAEKCATLELEMAKLKKRNKEENDRDVYSTRDLAINLSNTSMEGRENMKPEWLQWLTNK